MVIYQFFKPPQAHNFVAVGGAQVSFTSSVIQTLKTHTHTHTYPSDLKDRDAQTVYAES